MTARNLLWAIFGLVLAASCAGGSLTGGGQGGPTECTLPLRTCQSECVDIQTDAANCGACGFACTGGAHCTQGQCNSCGPGQLSCNNNCVNPQTDPANCGSCGTVCGSSQSCVSGVCACPPGRTSCLQACVDEQSDRANCGGCGVTCSDQGMCQGGACTCLAGLTQCGPNCVLTSSDPANCGNCGIQCPAGSVCNGNGQCAAGCNAGLTLCGQSCSNTMTDPNNCGRCGNLCSGGAACVNGNCACPVPGQLLCGTACVDTTNNDQNCGSCGNLCLGGQTCQAGTCQCGPGLTLCGTQCVNAATDPLHCGSSCTACATGQTCVAGICTGGGGGGTGGTGGGGGSGGSGGGRPTGCPAAPGLISDFEEGQGIVTPQQSRQGWWYVFNDGTPGVGVTPAPSGTGPVAVAAVPAADQSTCNHFAMHATATGHPMFVGVGASINQVLPPPAPGSNSKTKNKSDVSAYTGISFRIRSNSGNAPPILFEFLNDETQGAPDGTATNPSVNQYNTRGRLLTGISATWQTVTVPFGLLAPRYLPGDACNAGVFCEAPQFNPTSVLGVQFSLYDQFSTAGSYDLWIDDITLTTGDAGIASYTQSAGAFPFPRDAAVGSCTKPAGASGKFLIDAYLRWKNTFVVSAGGNQLRVRRPENNNDTVSEGIGYGMLIAVYMNDRPLFDGLWAYWQAHLGNAWQIDANGGVIGGGTATDADEDAAFALAMAVRQWGTSYTSARDSMIAFVWNSDIEAGSFAPKGGNQFGGAGQTNPSYFAPAYYRVFATIDSGHPWASAANESYTLLRNLGVLGGGNTGLVPAWCTSNCTTIGGGPSADADKYQYDSHRTPWRIGLDACWNNNADARAYVTNTSNFFASKAVAGVGTIADIYSTAGAIQGNAKENSMSAVGTAGVGAMVTAATNAGHSRFLNSAYHFILDATYTPDPTAQSGPTSAYTYFNATVGLLTALTMSGNFNNF